MQVPQAVKLHPLSFFFHPGSGRAQNRNPGVKHLATQQTSDLSGSSIYKYVGHATYISTWCSYWYACSVSLFSLNYLAQLLVRLWRKFSPTLQISFTSDVTKSFFITIILFTLFTSFDLRDDKYSAMQEGTIESNDRSVIWPGTCYHYTIPEL